MDLGGVIRSGSRRWLAAGAVVVAALGGVAGYTVIARPHHDATATLFMSSTSAPSITAVPDSGQQYLQQAAASFADVARRPIVLEPVISELDLHLTPSQLADRISSSVQPDTVLIDIRVTGDSSRESAQIANAVSQELVHVAGSLTPSGGTTQLRLTQVRSARASG